MNKEKFDSYVRVQRSGITNMVNIQAVISLADVVLTKEDCIDIMKNYEKYETEFSN